MTEVGGTVPRTFRKRLSALPLQPSAFNLNLGPLFFNLEPFPMTYVLITPARNEADYIELTIKSMIAQTSLPLKWVIVSDGSTDGTDDIIKKYLQAYPWIELVRTLERKERHFAGKVMAFNAGYEKVKNLSYDIIGNLDADLSFEKGYLNFFFPNLSKIPSSA